MQGGNYLRGGRANSWEEEENKSTMEEVLTVCVERSEAKKFRKNKQKRIKMTIDESAEKCNIGVDKQNKKMDRSQCINCEICFRREKRRALFRLVIEITNQWKKNSGGTKQSWKR